MKLIDKSALVAEIEKLKAYLLMPNAQLEAIQVCDNVISVINTLEVIDPYEYEECVQYPSIKAGIQVHAETYSFNIESELFNQLTKEQQELWRKEIEQACISGGEVGVELTKGPRYKEYVEIKEVNLDKEIDDYLLPITAQDVKEEPFTQLEKCAKHFFELGLKAHKGK